MSNQRDADRMTMREWARRQAPHRDVVSVSEPEPILLQHNLVAATTEPDVARLVVLEWERIRRPDGAVGMVALAGPHGSTTPTEVGKTGEPVGPAADPERVTGHAASRIVRGAVPGAIVFGAVVGLLAWAFGGSGAAAVGAALGGAAFGAIAGAVASFVVGTSWGSAYEQSFVDPSSTDLLFASIHADAVEEIEAAAQVVTGFEGIELYRVDPAGHVVGATRKV